MEIDLIYCASGNRRLTEYALAAGFKNGARLPGTVYHPVFFADQDWKRPNRAAYMAALAQHRPTMATVLDWERDEQLSEVLDWAEEAAQYVERVLIIPKVIGGITRLPRRVSGRDVVLAYSVPTRYGGTPLPIWEFHGWPVHLLGGSPHAQMNLVHYMNVVSADGNMANLMATRYTKFWAPKSSHYPGQYHWRPIERADGQSWGLDAPYEAFRRSCDNIIRAWRGLTPVE